MAYAAAFSLTRAIHDIPNMKPAYGELLSFIDVIKLHDVRFEYLDEKGEKAFDVFGQHLSSQFPSEYRLIRFARNHIEPLLGVLVGGPIAMLVGATGLRKLRGVAESLLSDLRESLVFTIQSLDEDISFFTRTVAELKEECDKGDWTTLPEDDGGQISEELAQIEKLFKGFIKFAKKILFSVLPRFHCSRSSSSNERLEYLDGRVREEIHTFQDTFESHVSNKFGSQQDSHQSPISMVDWHEVIPYIDSFSQSMKNLREQYIYELLNPQPAQGHVNDDSLSRASLGGNMTKMVGFFDEFYKIRDEVIGSWTNIKPKVVLLVGMAGIGKSTLARRLYGDETVSGHFDNCVWVTIGPKYQFKGIMREILSQVKPEANIILVEGEEKLAHYLFDILKEKRCLIVLDDVWDEGLWKYLKMLLPKYEGKKSHVLIMTTRLRKIAHSITKKDGHEIPFLDKEESWKLLREKVFGDKESCPIELVTAGRKIAENCEGLPLTIITVAQLLSKADMTPEYWNKEAEKKSSLFKDAYDQMMGVLIPSYKYLPQHLTVCFLYMGVFPQNHEISRTKLQKLWNAEGFFGSDPTNPKDYHHNKFEAHIYTLDLFSRSVVMVHNEVKTCGLHSAFWHLCVREAERTKFFHVLNRYDDISSESLKDQRRLCVYNNVLFSIKDVVNSIESISTTVRSLLCTGHYHQYPVPISLDLKLLRVLDALTLRFYEFPVQVSNQVQLKYLGLVCDGPLPPSISHLWYLQYLIITPHHRIINLHEDELYMPIEIWDMHELKYLQVMGNILPNPRGPQCFENLRELLDVSPTSCTENVFRQFPNLLKLGIRVELAPDDGSSNDEPFRCFSYIRFLEKLQSLKCVIVNPVLKSPPLAPRFISSNTLMKLTLSGCGFSWEDMKVIAALRCLRALKLQCYAFRGPTWEVEGRWTFSGLTFLTIEDTDLVHWKVGPQCFGFLTRLILKDCYKLQEIPREFGNNKFTLSIKLYDCNPLARIRAKLMEDEFEKIDVIVHSSLV